MIRQHALPGGFTMHRAFLPQPPARGRHALALAAVVAVLGCSTSDILNVDTPDIIPTVTSASGAIALKNGVILRLEQATNGSCWRTSTGLGTRSSSVTTWTSAYSIPPTRFSQGRFGR